MTAPRLRQALLVLLILSYLLLGTGDWQSAYVSTAAADPQGGRSYDLIVAGGEAEGVTAAVAASRSGLRTLLIEDREGLGGVLTYGELNFLDQMMHDDRNQSGGLFTEWHQQVGGGVAFEPERAKQVFLEMVRAEPNLTLELNMEITAPLLDQGGKRLVGLRTLAADGERTAYAKRFIDATEDADLAAHAGVPFFLGQSDIGIRGSMAVTLMIRLQGVDWEGLRRACLQNKFGGCQIGEDYAWGFGHLETAYQPHEPKTRLRGLNIARTQDGTVLINALQILNVDALKPDEKRAAYETGKRETAHVLSFLRRELPGFERAEIAGYPQELYVRETRHILAEYQLRVDDVWMNRDQWDRIGYGGYPVDVQATGESHKDLILADPAQYAIPFRSLVPLRVENLLVVGRAAGYSSLAAGSARVIPTGMVTGEAAGVAAEISIRFGHTFREMTANQSLISLLQHTLRARGALVEPFALPYPYQGNWYDPAVRQLLSFGLIAAGYSNDVRPHLGLTEEEFIRIAKRVIRLRSPERLLAVTAEWEQIGVTAAFLSRERMAAYFFAALGQPVPADPWSALQAHKGLDPILLQRLTGHKLVLRQEAYVLLAQILMRAN